MRANLTFKVLEQPQGFDPLGFEDFIYNGQPASAVPVFQPKRYASRFFYHKERTERNQLMSGLLLAGAVPAAVDKRTDQNPPDFEVALKACSPAFVEVTEGTTPGEKRLNNSIMYLNQAMAEWYHGDAIAQSRVSGWNLAFDISSPIPIADFDAAFDEIQDFIIHEPLGDYARDGKLPSIPDKYAALYRAGCDIICRPWENGGYVWVKVNARAVGGPYSDAATVWGCIEGKRQKAVQWSVGPLWLVVSVDLPWQVQDTLDVLRPYISNIDPFERVILGAGRHGMMVSR
jgi:hypothetical protein